MACGLVGLMRRWQFLALIVVSCLVVPEWTLLGHLKPVGWPKEAFQGDVQ